MQINYNKDAEKLTVAPEGRLDTATALEFEKTLGELLNGVSDLILDMKKVTYVSSAGLRVLLKLRCFAALQQADFYKKSKGFEHCVMDNDCALHHRLAFTYSVRK